MDPHAVTTDTVITVTGARGEPLLPDDVAELLEQLQDVHDHTQFVLGVVRALNDAAWQLDDRTEFASRWADLLQVQDVYGQVAMVLGPAWEAVEICHRNALALLLQACLAVLRDLATGRVPSRAVIAASLGPDIPLIELRTGIADIMLDALGDLADGSYGLNVERSRSAAIAAIEDAIASTVIDRPRFVGIADGSAVKRSSLAGLTKAGTSHDEAVISALVALADALTVALRSRRV